MQIIKFVQYIKTYNMDFGNHIVERDIHARICAVANRIIGIDKGPLSIGFR